MYYQFFREIDLFKSYTLKHSNFPVSDYTYEGVPTDIVLQELSSYEPQPLKEISYCYLQAAEDEYARNFDSGALEHLEPGISLLAMFPDEHSTSQLLWAYALGANIYLDEDPEKAPKFIAPYLALAATEEGKKHVDDEAFFLALLGLARSYVELRRYAEARQMALNIRDRVPQEKPHLMAVLYVLLAQTYVLDIYSSNQQEYASFYLEQAREIALKAGDGYIQDVAEELLEYLGDEE